MKTSGRWRSLPRSSKLSGFVMLILFAGWVFPLSILERKRLAYSRALTAYISGLTPTPPPAPLLPPIEDDV